MDTAALVFILVMVFIAAVIAILRRLLRNPEGGAEPPPSEFEEAIQQREELKSGHLWGDIPSDPRLH